MRDAGGVCCFKEADGWGDLRRGLLKRAYLAEALGEVSVDVQKKIKDALDPEGIPNPEKVFER